MTAIRFACTKVLVSSNEIKSNGNLITAALKRESLRECLLVVVERSKRLLLVCGTSGRSLHFRYPMPLKKYHQTFQYEYHVVGKQQH